MKAQYALRCLAPDGEHVTESQDFRTTDDAWERSEDMGSRWVFYPVHIVTTTSNRRPIIRAVPQGMPQAWVGRRLETLKTAFQRHPEHALGYCQGNAPFLIHP